MDNIGAVVFARRTEVAEEEEEVIRELDKKYDNMKVSQVREGGRGDKKAGQEIRYYEGQLGEGGRGYQRTGQEIR